MRLRVIVLLAAVAAGLGFAFAVADGEAGLVIDWGDGSTSQYCVAFEGESISGDRLLARAGLNVNQFSGLVCGINSVGCQHSGTFNSCTCECQELGGGDCVYWAFFSKNYGGQWSYSASGFQGQPASDGDMHAWRWGEGGPASAPAPAPVSFEQVCGHPPRSIASPTPRPTATRPAPTPTNTPTQPPPTSTSAPTATPTATSEPSPTPSPAETATATGEASPSPSATPSPSPTVEETLPASTQPPGTSPTVSAPAAGDPSGGGGNPGTLAAFGAVAGGLAILAAAGWLWRARHGG